MPNINRYYAPRIRTTQVVGSLYPPTTTTIDTAFLKHIKSDVPNRGIVDPDGFRRPAPWSMEWSDGQTIMIGSSSYTASGSTTIVSGPQNFSCLYAVADPVPGGMVASTEISAMKKLRDVKIDVAVTIAERKQTANMFYDNAVKIARAYKLFRRKKYKRAAKELGISVPGVRDRWLEYRYGWVPLMNDIYNACKLIQEKDKTNPQRLRSHVSAERLEDTQTSRSIYGSYYEVKEIRRQWFRCFVRFDFGPPIGFAEHLKTLDDFGLLNPASVAWELVPFSFVVDWFLPVGDYLGSLGIVPFTYRGGSRTEFTTCTVVGTAHAYKGASNITNPVVRGSQRSAAKRFRRQTYVTWPFPNPSGVLRMDQHSASLALIGKRCLDALALLGQAFAGARR